MQKRYAEQLKRGGYSSTAATTPILDRIGLTALAAYGLRRLRRGYAGMCVNLRRSSDNATQDFGFVGKNLDLAGITAWANGSSVFVAKWYDQSGSGLDAANATAANQPQLIPSVAAVGGKPGILFGDASAFALGTVSSGASIFGAGGFASVIVNLTGVPTATDAIWSHGSASHTITALRRQGLTQNIGGHWTVSPQAAVGAHIFTIAYSSASISNQATLTQDNASQSFVTDTLPSSITAESGSILIGNGALTAGTSGLPGHLSELILAQTQPNAANQNALYRDQKAWARTP